MVDNIKIIKGYFETGDVPTEQQFTKLIERDMLSWINDIDANDSLIAGQYIDYLDVIYRIDTGYDVGSPKTWDAGNATAKGASGAPDPLKADKAVVSAPAWPTALKADANTAFTDVFSMSGDLALTVDDTGAVPHYGETREILGDGNNINISGNTLQTQISTASTRLVQLANFWNGNKMIVKDLNATETALGDLQTPTLVFTAQDAELDYSIANVDSNATGGVFEYDTDPGFGSPTPVPGWSFGTLVGEITGLVNGTTYYGRVQYTASGFNPSAYGTDSEAPISGIVQLTAPTMSPATVDGALTMTVDCNDPNTAPQESFMLFRRALNAGMSTSLITSQQPAGTINFQWTGLDDNTTYYFDVIAEGNGSTTSNSDPSNVVSATTLQLPENVTSAVFAYDGSLGVTEGVQGITNWTDQTSNAYDAVQGTQIEEPAYSNPIVSFPGSVYLDASAAGGDMQGNQQGEVFILLEGSTNAVTRALTVSRSDFNDADYMQIMRFNDAHALSGKVRINMVVGGVNNQISTPTTELTDGETAIFSLSTNGSRYRINKNNGSDYTLDVDLGSDDGMWLADASGVMNQPFLGLLRRSTDAFSDDFDLTYLAYYGTELSSGDRTNIFDYLNSKFTIY